MYNLKYLIFIVLTLLASTYLVYQLKPNYSHKVTNNSQLYKLDVNNIETIIIHSSKTDIHPLLQKMQIQTGIKLTSNQDNIIKNKLVIKKIKKLGFLKMPSYDFFIASHKDYPANAKSISEFYFEISKIKTQSAIITNPSIMQLDHFGLNIQSNPNAIKIELLENNNKSLYTIIIGNYYSSLKKRKYIYHQQSGSIYLSSDQIQLNTNPVFYFKSNITDFSITMIDSITDYVNYSDIFTISKKLVTKDLTSNDDNNTHKSKHHSNALDVDTLEDKSFDPNPQKTVQFSLKKNLNSDSLLTSNSNNLNLNNLNKEPDLDVNQNYKTLNNNNEDNFENLTNEDKNTNKTDEIIINKQYHKDLYQFFYAVSNLAFIDFFRPSNSIFKDINFIHTMDINLTNELIYEIHLAKNQLDLKPDLDQSNKDNKADKDINNQAIKNDQNQINNKINNNLSKLNPNKQHKYFLKIVIKNNNPYKQVDTNKNKYLNNWIYQISFSTYNYLNTALSSSITDIEL